MCGFGVMLSTMRRCGDRVEELREERGRREKGARRRDARVVDVELEPMGPGERRYSSGEASGCDEGDGLSAASSQDREEGMAKRTGCHKHDEMIVARSECLLGWVI